MVKIRLIALLICMASVHATAQVLKVVEKKSDRQPVLSFSCTDINGKQVSIADLKGKVIYLDIWATWCMPCRAQFPKMAELKKTFEGKDVVFLYVSTDTDKAKWENFLRTKKPEGVQLFADKFFNTEFMKKYNITAIPRFMLIDKSGNVYSYDALRPGQYGIEEEIEKLLAEG